MKHKKSALMQSVIALLLCISMLVGTTFAWFTDSVASGLNTIAAGNLDVELYHTNAATRDEKVEPSTDLFLDLQGEPILWEPGVVSYENLRIVNAGDLALAYQMAINTANENYVLDPSGARYGLSQILKVGVVEDGITATDRAGVVASVAEGSWTTLADFLRNGSLLPEGAGESEKTWGIVIYWEPGENDNLWNLNNGKQLSSGEELQIELGISLIATQEAYEADAFGTDYDIGAKAAVFPEFAGGTADADVTVDGQNLTTAEVTMTSGAVSAVVPAGVKVAEGVSKLTLTVTPMDASGANISLGDNEDMRSLDVHIEGVDPANTTPIVVTLKEVAPTGLNMGNYKLYHVENGSTNEMTLLDSAADFTAHNQFKYDPATGDIVLYMATFSEVSLVADTVNAWNGEFDYGWYSADAEELTIANADQLAGFGAIVGGMLGQTQNSFAGKTVKLISDINLGDAEDKNNPDLIFYPIGYYNSEGTYERTNTAITSGLRNFEGTFDGAGHTIANFYQNTWEMKGDHDWYSPEEQYYRDGMGLFGKIYGGTVKNLTINNFKSDGEIATTGCIAAYADGATFENIAIFNCNPRVYNIGNGGIVGCVGWYAKEANLKTTFKNITVDNSNKISALWGSYDVACGGIVGQYYPTSGQTSAGTPQNAGVHFDNCHVSAIMDVYNDVCANYQYYAYRYAGMLIGSVRENETINGHSYPKMDGISAENCTVHFGTWNDYYYCELVDNTTASYTHDYQMSRLVEIKAINGTTITYLDGTTGTVPASGRANYVIVDYTKGHGTQNATCYHFKDGDVWTHDMGGIQTGIDENGDGQDDLKEDKQHIYLEFNNLVTGYGWGVTSRGFANLDGVTNLDITQGNQEASVEKFEKKLTAEDAALEAGQVYKVGDLFTAIDGANINDSAVQVAVTAVNDSGITAEYVASTTDNWEDGTLTFNKIEGICSVTIQDYNFCKPTTIILKDGKLHDLQKFNIVFPNVDTYLYRVGNMNEIALSSLFAEEGVVVDKNVNITITGVEDFTYTANSTEWEKGTIHFNNKTGLARITIDEDGVGAKTLKVEVVDAKNYPSPTTGASLNATANNVVLLSNCGFSTVDISNGYSLYGNGFTMTCGSDSVASDMGYAFVTLSDGTLDNVQIVCPNFDYAALYKSNLTSSDNRSETDANGKTRYYNAKSGVMVSGNSQILNSRISGARAAVNVSGGNCVIDNSRIELGAVASILVGAANSLTLRDVTLVQKPTASTYDSSKTLMGFSVLVMCTSGGNAAPITLEGTLVQNAWVDENDKQYVPEDAQTIIDTVMGEEDYLHDIDGDGTNESLNLGIAYMPADGEYTVNTPSITENRSNKDAIPYGSVEVKYSTVTTYVYSYKNTNGTDDSTKVDGEYAPDTQSDMITVTYSDTADGLTTGKSYGTDGWIYELNVDMDKLPGYTIDFSMLSMSVNGVPVTDFNVDGSAKPTEPVAVTAGGTTYTLTATVNDKEYTAAFKVTGTETSKESPSLVASNYEAGLCVASSYGGTWHGAAPVLEGIQIKYWSVAEKQYKTITLSDYTPTTAGKQNGTNAEWTYSPDNGDFTLTIKNETAVHSGNSVYAMPVVCDSKLYFVASSSNGLVNSGNSARTIKINYYFKDNNGGEQLSWNYTWSVEENKDAQYKYSDFCNGTLTKLENCITSDTLITLADGTQVRVDTLTGTEELLVWNLQTGKYDVAPIVFVDSEQKSEYEIIHLYFSDGSDVKVISEHGFFDLNLGKYVYIDAQNYADYVGHAFVAEGKISANEWDIVTLDEVVLETEVTTAWSPVTFEHLCYYTNGVLSMPGGIDGLFNIFEVDTDSMTYNAEQMQKDIENYGLFTLEDFGGLITEEAFQAFNGAYLKVAMGKGLLTWEDIAYMAERYIPLM